MVTIDSSVTNRVTRRARAHAAAQAAAAVRGTALCETSVAAMPVAPTALDATTGYGKRSFNWTNSATKPLTRTLRRRTICRK